MGPNLIYKFNNSTMAKGLFIRWLQDVDCFDRHMNLTFRKQSTFTTPVGATVSLLGLFLFLIFFTVRTLQLVDGSNPFFTMLTFENSVNQIDLNRLDFFFAIERVDPRYGRIQA